jgi:hypothetical protein
MLTNAQPEPAAGPLQQVARQHRWRLLATYGLITTESLLALAQPLALGLAVDGVLAGSTTGLFLFAAQQALTLGLGVARRAYDTRLFTRMASELAGRLVVAQRAAGVDLSQVAARAGLSRQLVDFFERDLPFVFHCLLTGIGAMVMLAVTSLPALPFCLVALVIAGGLGRVYGRYSQRWNQNLHDEMERAVGVIAGGDKDKVLAHYRCLSAWQVRLSDGEALYFGLWQALALLLTGAVLLQCSNASANAGRITTMLGYVQMLITTLVNLPRIIDQAARLCDICRRVAACTPEIRKPMGGSDDATFAPLPIQVRADDLATG